MSSHPTHLLNGCNIEQLNLLYWQIKSGLSIFMWKVETCISNLTCILNIPDIFNPNNYKKFLMPAVL